jgi:hypothetical protein
MMVPDGSRDDFPFGELIGGHTWKLQAAHGMALMLAFLRGGDGAPDRAVPATGVLEVLARKHNKAKQRGLYTDIDGDGIWDPARITREQAKGMTAAVRAILDTGGFLADPEFITWLAAMPEDVKPEVDAFWTKLLQGWEAGGYDGMADAIQEAMTEAGAIDGMGEMLREQDARLAISGAPKPPRTQPRRPPPRSRRRKT